MDIMELQQINTFNAACFYYANHYDAGKHSVEDVNNFYVAEYIQNPAKEEQKSREALVFDYQRLGDVEAIENAVDGRLAEYQKQNNNYALFINESAAVVNPKIEEQPYSYVHIVKWSHPSPQPTYTDLMQYTVEQVREYYQDQVHGPAEIQAAPVPEFTQAQIDRIDPAKLKVSSIIFNTTTQTPQIFINGVWRSLSLI